jgi:type II secretory pathway predicted ATPase ExeA
MVSTNISEPNQDRGQGMVKVVQEVGSDKMFLLQVMSETISESRYSVMVR